MDDVATIDIANSATFQPTTTYTLNPGDFYNWPDDAELWLRVSPNQLATGVNVWIHPGSNAAPPAANTLTGVNATELQGFPISTVAPNTGQALVWNGSLYVPQSVTSNPTGPAGGDLAGTYPNPQVAGLRSVPVSASAPSGAQVLLYNAGQWLPSFLAGDIIAAATPNVYQVRGLFGAAISSPGSTPGQILVFNGVQWVPQLPASASQFPLVISSTSQFTFPILTAGTAQEIMNNGSSIPAAYNQGSYRISGYLNVNVACNVTITTTVIDATGIRSTYTPVWQLQNSGFAQTISGSSMPISNWTMIPVTLYQAPTGVGERVILNVGATAPGVVASFVLEQLTAA